jgi:hypothetical protein
MINDLNCEKRSKMYTQHSVYEDVKNKLKKSSGDLKKYILKV